jgi:hypothetical protein
MSFNAVRNGVHSMIARRPLLSAVAGAAVVAGLCFRLLPPAPALPVKQSWNQTTRVAPDAEVPGWFINLGVTGARAKLTEAEPKGA